MIFGINTLSVKPELAAGGYLRELLTHLARVDSDNEYRLFVCAPDRDRFNIDAPNFRVIAAPPTLYGPGQRFAAQQLWLPLAVRRSGVHALLCPAASIPLLLAQPAVITVPHLLSLAPDLSAGGGTLHRWRSRARDRYERLCTRLSARRAAAVLTLSELTRREVARHYAVHPARIVVARQGVSARFQPVEAPERIAALLERHGLQPPFVLAVGPLSPYKNLDRALEGLAQVRRWSHRLPMLALVGGDRFRCRPGLERLAAALALDEHVRFLDLLPETDLPALYTAATASLSLSPAEAFGLPIIESMACGCPVICARRSALPEIAGDAALFVDPDRPQEIAEAIWRLATLPNIRDAWVEVGLERARQFDWHETARLTRDTLLAAAAGRPPLEASRTRLSAKREPHPQVRD